MSQAFFTSIAGIAAAQSKIDVVADNIANMNTVAFKSSNLNFQNIYARTLSSGSSPTSEKGGTNPLQVGLGVTIGGISRNFTSGTVQSTGKSSDLNIQGTGFFTLKGEEGTLLTRAGNFTLDSQGYMVTNQGIRVLGMSSIFDQYASEVPIKIPPSLSLVKTGKDLTVVGNDNLSDLNNASITQGTFSIKVTDSSNASKTINVDISDINGKVAATADAALATTAASDASTYAAANPADAAGTAAAARAVADANPDSIEADKAADAAEAFAIANPANAAGTAAAAAAIATTATTNANALVLTPATTLTDIKTAITNAFDRQGTFGTVAGGDLSITPTVNADGTFSLSYDDTGVGSPAKLEFTSGTSNFLSETGLATVAEDPATNSYKSNILSLTVAIGAPDNIYEASSKLSYSIGSGGEIEATYSNGDKISVETVDGKKELIYKTSTGVIVRSSDITVNDATVLEPANLQLQLASVVNEEGLLSKGSNVFTLGPNSGSATFSAGSTNGFGLVASGGLESSNVDLPTEFAQMILSQRAIDANSRTFSAMNQIMQSIVNLGR